MKETAALDYFGVTYEVVTDSYMRKHGGLKSAAENLGLRPPEWTKPQRMDTACAYLICKRDENFKRYSSWSAEQLLGIVKEVADKLSGV